MATSVYRPIARCILSILLVAASIGLPPGQAAAETVRETTSLGFVPAGAAFYLSMLRNREQFDAVANSRAVRQILELPLVKENLDNLWSQWEQPERAEVATAKAILSLPENKQILELFTDALSHEIFFYGDASVADTLELLNGINREINRIQFEAIGSGGVVERDLGQRLLDVLQRHVAQFKVPDVVMGFKLTNIERAKFQLARLEAMGMLLEQVPPLRGRLRRVKFGEGDFLSLALDGSLIPWQEVDLDVLGDEREAAESLIDRVKQMTLTISIGVRGDYLLMSVGDTNEHLELLGEGNLLMDVDKMAPLRNQADQRIASISYISDAFMKRISRVDQQIEDSVLMGQQMLKLAPLSEELQAEISSDLASLGEDIKAWIPEPGALLSYAFLTSEGVEGYTYNWSQYRRLDGSQRLSILDHVGGDPILVLAGRAKSSPDEYEVLAKWCRRAMYYVEEIGVPQLDDHQQTAYQNIRDRLMPLMKRLDTTTREKLIPSSQDGQAALVVDAKPTGYTWHRDMPRPAEPLPMLEVGLLLGLNDAPTFKQACRDYFALAQDTLDALRSSQEDVEQLDEEAAERLRELFPDDLESDIPPPEPTPIVSGTIYQYPVPSELGVDPRLAPNMGISDAFVAFTPMPDFTRRLLAESPLGAGGVPVDYDRPLASAVYLRWAGMMEAIGPWIDYAVHLTMADPPSSDDEVAAQRVKQALEILPSAIRFASCFRSFTSLTSIENETLVTHFTWHFRDLE